MQQGLGGLRVLLADDSDRMRTILSALLNAVGIERIKEAGSGEQALAFFRSWNPDIAIVDYRMTPLDGLAFTRMVRGSPEGLNPYMPIIMLTAHSEAAEVIAARDAGVTEILVKPATAASVLDRVSRAVFRPRPFIRAATYVGPDRRRRSDPHFLGPFRRRDDIERATGS
jgi:two-component system, chemotaxis family, chemotaxis protein CheY